MAMRALAVDPTINDLIETYERIGSFPVSVATYVRLSLDDPHLKWELHDGLLVEKPGMSFTHLDATSLLNYQLTRQLDVREFRVLVNDGRLRRSVRTYLIPDIAVVASNVVRSLRRAQPSGLGVFDDPFQFVAEFWSPATVIYDINVKIPVYKQRGDQEIWRVSPFEQTVTMWRRQDDGSYSEQVVTSGTIALHALPNVVVDLDALFAFN